MAVAESGGDVTGPTCSAKVAKLHPTLDETVGVGDGQTVHTDLQGGDGSGDGGGGGGGSRSGSGSGGGI